MRPRAWLLVVLLSTGASRAQAPAASASDRAFPTLGVTLLASGVTTLLVGGTFALLARAEGKSPRPLDWSLLGLGSAAFIAGSALVLVALATDRAPGDRPMFVLVPDLRGGLVGALHVRF